MFISKIIKRNTSNLSNIKYNNPLYYIEKSFDTHKSLVEKMLGMAIAGLAGTCILLKNDIDKKFEGIDKKIEIMEEKNNKRFDDIDNKIDRLETLLINLNNKKSSWF